MGVVGLGGLGHMAVKLAASFGAEVTVLSRSPQKEPDARRLGGLATPEGLCITGFLRITRSLLVFLPPLRKGGGNLLGAAIFEITALDK